MLLHRIERNPETFKVDVAAARLGLPGIEPEDEDMDPGAVEEPVGEIENCVSDIWDRIHNTLIILET